LFCTSEQGIQALTAFSDEKIHPMSTIDFKTNFILNFYHIKTKSSKFCVEKYSQNLVRQNLKRSKNGLKNRTKIFKPGKKANENGKKAVFFPKSA